MARKYRPFSIGTDGPKIQKLKQLNEACKPIKAKFMELREQFLKLSAEQKQYKDQLQQLGTKYQNLRDEMLASGLDPKVLAEMIAGS